MAIDLSHPLPGLEPARNEGGLPFGSVRVLVRIHTWPVGFVDVSLIDGLISGDALAAEIDRRLGNAIRQHLVADGVAMDMPLTARGLDAIEAPACLDDRRRTLAAAPSISVVVPTVDRPEQLRSCLVSLLEQQYPSFDIVVVDNAPSESGASQVVTSIAAHPQKLRYVAEPRRGASRARNRGLREAAGELVVFIDGDVRTDPSCLAALATAASKPTVGRAPVSCVTGAILPAELQTPAQLWMEEWGGYSKGFERRTFDLTDNRPPSPLYPYAAAIFGSGAAMAFRTAELRALGGFDTALGGGTPARSGEDLAAFLDVVTSGGTIVYEPGAIVWHSHPNTEAQFRATLHAYGVGLTAYVLRHVLRHPGDAVRLALALPAALAYFLRADSGRNARRSGNFPGGTWRDEVSGMFRGPFAYALGRIIAGRGQHSAADR